jgi:hypothetical protein
MDRIRTLLLARTHVVVMDPDLVAQAATRPVRDVDVEKLELELVKLGYVLSLDLATTLRRLPFQAVQDLRGWIRDTLGASPRPQPQTVRGEQPCPWCGDITVVGSLDPCGHIVCKSCWDGTNFPNCPICHRRVTFVATAPAQPLTLVHLGLDPLGMAKQRFQELLARPSPLSLADREEVDAVIDTIGPKAVTWLPHRIHLKETMAAAISRLLLISPDRSAMVKQCVEQLASATDVLRVTCVLMGGNAALANPMKLTSLPRGMRRALLEALEQLPLENVVEDMMRHRQLWKRVGQRLHPYEHATKLPNTAVAFAVLRRTKPAAVSFGDALRERAVSLPFLALEEDVIKPIAWAGPIEDALRAGNPRSALARLTHRPAELLLRADHLVRTAQTRQLDALQTVLKAVELAAAKGPASTLLTLAAHVARRARPWPRRMFIPHGHVLAAWGTDDTRTTLRGDAIAVMVGSIRRQLLIRAEPRRQFPRAVIDRALVDLIVPLGTRAMSRTKLLWPRGSEVALPDGQAARLALQWDSPPDRRIELRFSVELFDASWRHMATSDRKDPFVDLHLEKLAMAGARHAVMVIFSAQAARFERLGAHVAVGEELRFDLRGRSVLTVPLTIDLSERRLRWIDVRIAQQDLKQVGGYRAALAHIGRDIANLVGRQTRPTMWDVACIHAAARANTIYIRERDGSLTVYKRRDNESKVARLGRMMSGAADDGHLATIPTTDAPTWFALVSALPLPRGSQGYALDARGAPPGTELVAAGDLVLELAK